VIQRKGFALVAALLALLLIAALIASVFFAASEETRISSASSAKEAALSAAESAIELTMRDWASSIGDSISLGGVRSSTVDALGVPVGVHVTRLDSTLYAIVAEVSSVPSQSPASRRIGVIVRAHFAPDHSITIDRVPERWWSELF
jgi:Tfp pilus assembly protein PilX